MKRYFLYIAAIAILLISCQFSTESVGKTYSAQLVSNEIASPRLLDSIQSQIYDAFVKGMINKSAAPMTEMNKQLGSLYEESPNKLIHYWQAYLSYYKAIFHLQMNQQKASEEAVEDGITLLEDMSRKNSEDFALLALMESFSLQFKSSMKLAFVSGDVKEHAQKSKELNPENPRAYFVLGSNDFYTPEKYGGKKKAESYLKKAISLPAQEQPNPYLPSWGVEESYEMLVKYYIQEEEWENAKKYFAEAREKYPNNYRINEMAPKLVGK